MVSTRQMSIINGGAADGQNAAEQGAVARPVELENHGAPQPPSEVVNFRVTRYNSQHHGGAPEPAPGPSSRKMPLDPEPITLMDLPQEVTEKILRYLPFKNVCQLRLMNTKMDALCGQVLNSTFQKLQAQMLSRFQVIKGKMPRRESARRNHPLACESDIIETLHMRLTLLQMSFGKHIERKHCCFFPGEILDEVHNILHYIRVTPKLSRPYKVTDELFDLSTMAMEYFKEKIEPNLPEIAYFGTDFLDFTGTFPSSGTSKYLALDSSPLGPEEAKEVDHPNIDILDNEEPLPQSNMVLRKRIKRIKQGMKKYNSQLSMLKQDLRTCKRKTAEQQKQISEQQRQLAEQQKQTLEYANRLDENDKKNEEISRKFSTLLQELNKCKTELQYWRSKSPATPPFCSGCGNIIPAPSEDLEALINQGVIPDALEVLDFIPIAGTSAEKMDPDNEVQSLELDEAPPPEVRTTKRKIEEPKETPPTAKSNRRNTKNRSKRMKL